MSSTKIGNKAELLECSNDCKNRYPNAKVKIANGRVSRSGSLLEVSPSRFRPFLLLKNEPVISPSSAVNPRNVPIANATTANPPKRGAISSSISATEIKVIISVAEDYNINN